MNLKKFDEFQGKDVMLATICNKNGCTAEILNFGCILHSLKVPDKNGKFLDVVIGHKDAQTYFEDGAYHGATIGRYGNRIANGEMNVNGTLYQLALNNDGLNHLHGGNIGYNRRFWDYSNVTDHSVTLSLTDKDGEEQYPGTVLVSVTYTLTDDNALTIEYKASTDADTYFNPTNHSYFNLSGYQGGTITDHILEIKADAYTPTDDDLIPTGEIKSVDNTPFDFRTEKPIAQDLLADDADLKRGNGYDHNMILGEPGVYKENCCTVTDNKSGIVMYVSTDMPAVQLYIGNFLDGSYVGKDNKPIEKRTGMCLETQYYPDTPNHPNFPSCLIKPGKEFYSKTEYRFSVK